MEPITIDPNDLRDGDTLVIRIPFTKGDPIRFSSATPKLHDVEGVMREDYGSMKKRIDFHGPYTVSGERNVPSLPTKNGAVLYPYDVNQDCVFAKDEDGDWYAPGGSHYSDDDARECLTNGTHYVAFEGVDGA